MVKAKKTPKRKAAILANATSTRTSPLFEPIAHDTTATATATTPAGQTTAWPSLSETPAELSIFVRLAAIRSF